MTTTSEKDFLTEVLEHDPKHYTPDPAYEFSNERVFESTDHTDSGIYDGS